MQGENALQVTGCWRLCVRAGHFPSLFYLNSLSISKDVIRQFIPSTHRCNKETGIFNTYFLDLDEGLIIGRMMIERSF